jgi:hypothetical protein
MRSHPVGCVDFFLKAFIARSFEIGAALTPLPTKIDSSATPCLLFGQALSPLTRFSTAVYWFMRIKT